MRYAFIRAVGRDAVKLAVTRDGESKAYRVRNDYVFVMAGGEPPYPLLKGMGVEFGGDQAEPVAEAAGD